MNSEWELKQLIVEIGKRIWMRGYVASNDGNITVKLNDKELLTTPTGVSKGFMNTDMIIKVDNNGKVISGNSKYRPSSEVKMHLEVYKERPDIKSVVHAHPPYATSFAVAGIPLNKCILPEAIIVIGSVPIAKYGLPSTMEIPENIREHIKKSDAILLENHGALTLGTDLLNAYHKMETLEHTANIVWKAIQLGNVNVLPDNERDRLVALRSSFGLNGPLATCDSTPMPSNSEQISNPNKIEITEQTIREIAERVINKLKQK
ncbi:MAG: class II aldolase/adducin family protein [Ignavibacteriales bacterium]|nr:MAG: class II aldolase/adducin family protein [Ignavibacteriales bacterium]